MQVATPSPLRTRRHALPRFSALVADCPPAPHSPLGLVRRRALVQRLTSAADARVAALIAPPGYGKTSLLHDWSDQDERPFVWLSAAALRAGPFIPTWAPGAELPAALEHGLVLALDDAQLMHPVILAELVETVLPQLPPHSTLALACRADPELPLGRLRAHRQLIELRDADLALTTPEVGRVLRAAGLDLKAPDVRDIVEVIAQRTEGWPVGVYLAAVSLRGRSDLAAHARDFSGSDHLVTEYFRDEVLSGLSRGVRSFMT